MREIVGRYGHDEEVATGFYNQLGGEERARLRLQRRHFFHERA